MSVCVPCEKTPWINLWRRDIFGISKCQESWFFALLFRNDRPLRDCCCSPVYRLNASLSISQQPGLLLVANHYSLSSFPNRRAAEGRCSGLPANATRRMWSRLRRVSSSGGPGFGRHWWRNRVARKRRRWERLADYIYMSFVMYEVHTVVS